MCHRKVSTDLTAVKLRLPDNLLTAGLPIEAQTIDRLGQELSHGDNPSLKE